MLNFNYFFYNLFLTWHDLNTGSFFFSVAGSPFEVSNPSGPRPRPAPTTPLSSGSCLRWPLLEHHPQTRTKSGKASNFCRPIACRHRFAGYPIATGTAIVSKGGISERMSARPYAGIAFRAVRLRPGRLPGNVVRRPIACRHRLSGFPIAKGSVSGYRWTLSARSYAGVAC